MLAPTTPEAQFIATMRLPEVVDALAEKVVELMGDSRANDPEALVDEQEMCRILGVSTPTIRKMRADGCPFHQVCDSRRYLPSEVVAWTRRGGAK